MAIQPDLTRLERDGGSGDEGCGAGARAAAPDGERTAAPAPAMGWRDMGGQGLWRMAED